MQWLSCCCAVQGGTAASALDEEGGGGATSSTTVGGGAAEEKAGDPFAESPEIVAATPLPARWPGRCHELALERKVPGTLLGMEVRHIAGRLYVGRVTTGGLVDAANRARDCEGLPALAIGDLIERVNDVVGSDQALVAEMQRAAAVRICWSRPGVKSRRRCVETAEPSPAPAEAAKDAPPPRLQAEDIPPPPHAVFPTVSAAGAWQSALVVDTDAGGGGGGQGSMSSSGFPRRSSSVPMPTTPGASPSGRKSLPMQRRQSMTGMASGHGGPAGRQSALAPTGRRGSVARS